MAVPSVEICEPWATTGDVCSPCNDYSFDTTLLENSIQFASWWLYNATGQQWAGNCTETVRPDTCGCTTKAGCGGVSEIILPGYPVTAITEVRRDGAVVPAALYRVDDYRRLVYLPDRSLSPHGAWPCCQKIDNKPGDLTDTWSVTYGFGVDPPQGGTTAAAVLGCEFALACEPETVGQCRLPKRTQSYARQAVTVGVQADPASLFPEGRTGLLEVDAFLSGVELARTKRRARVIVPGKRNKYRRAT